MPGENALADFVNVPVKRLIFRIFGLAETTDTTAIYIHRASLVRLQVAFAAKLAILMDASLVDMFETVFKKDPLSAEAGLRYRREILEPGGEREEMESLTRFLGRPPSNEAFMKKLLHGA